MLNPKKSKVNIACVSLALLGLSVVPAKADPVKEIIVHHENLILLARACIPETGHVFHQRARDDYRRTLYALGFLSSEVEQLIAELEMEMEVKGQVEGIRSIIKKGRNEGKREWFCIYQQGMLGGDIKKVKHRLGIKK